MEGPFRSLSAEPRLSSRPSSEQTLIDELNRTFAAADYQPPMLPSAALEILTLARDPNVSFGKIVGLLESEPLIAARVLRIAQSPFYSSGAKVQTIDDAVLRLGIRTLRSCLPRPPPTRRFFRARYFERPCRRCVGTAR